MEENKPLEVQGIASILEKEGHSNVQQGIIYLKDFVNYLLEINDSLELHDEINDHLNSYIGKYLNPFSKDWFEDSGIVYRDYETEKIKNYGSNNKKYFFSVLGYQMFNILYTNSNNES